MLRGGSEFGLAGRGDSAGMGQAVLFGGREEGVCPGCDSTAAKTGGGWPEGGAEGWVTFGELEELKYKSLTIRALTTQ